MNKKRDRELLKTMKPMHSAPTLFGLSLREFVIALVAVGAVLVAIFK
jgi:hypothetical protein